MLDLKLFNIDDLVNKFLLDKQQGIVTLHRLYFKNNNQISYRALVEELFEELKAGCITFINKNDSIEDLDFYLFYIVNAFCKKIAVPSVKKQKEYLCPGCLFLGKENLINLTDSLTCHDCTVAFKSATDPKWSYFFNSFKTHSKLGFRCTDCERFIPQSISLDENIVCPYIDCCFVGEADSLKRMNHPNSQTNIKHISITDKSQLVSNEIDALSKVMMQQEVETRFKLINDVIDQQINTSHWNSFNFTIKHKIFVYQAFKNVLSKFPLEMTSYLLDGSRSGGFQHKLFQEYISILEKNLPIPYKQNKQIYQISSLLDEKLSLFDGISVFEATVTSKGEIKNKTKEIYIGGRKSSYVKPYYIGKLLNIVITDTQEPIMHLVESYSFSKIKLQNIKPETNVTVTHLRVPPHYQMGGMVYVNRIRKKIIDKVNLLLDKDNEN